MGSAESGSRADEAVTSMNAIADLSEKWMEYIREREWRVRLAKSFITGALVFLATSAAIVAYVLMQSPPTYFFRHAEILPGMGIGALAGLGCGVVVYLALGRRRNSEVDELTGLVGRMRKSNEEGSGTESALSVAEKILELLPKMVRRRGNDALLFGIAAFILGSMLGTPAVGIIVGVLVWLYFRYESNQSYERHVAKLENQRMQFEKEKKSFLESL